MNYGVMLLILVVFGFFGLWWILTPVMRRYAIERVARKLKGKIKEKTISKVYVLMGVITFALFIHGLIVGRGEHLNSTYEYTTYPIEKCTFNSVEFNNTSQNLNESYVIVEEPNSEYQNVVVKEKENYEIQWFCRVKWTSNKYHVYLSEDVYERLKDKDVIYKAD